MSLKTMDLNFFPLYVDYEIPYRGVSQQNPAGHLMLALRNKSDKRPLGEPFEKLINVGCLSQSTSSHVKGLLGLNAWQLFFIPCVVVSPPNSCIPTEDLRCTLLQSFVRTIPIIYRPWASGHPGTIPLASIECLIAEDSHGRISKFDPILNKWLPTNDGTRLDSSPTTGLGKFHTPHRLVILTTDFNAYTFRLWTNNHLFNNIKSNAPFGSISNILANDAPTATASTQLARDKASRERKKNTIKRSMEQLTRRLSWVRSASGCQLAEEFAASLSLVTAPITSNRLFASENDPPATVTMGIGGNAGITEPLGELRSPPNHLELFAHLNDVEDELAIEKLEDSVDRAINMHPVNPLERLGQKWYISTPMLDAVASDLQDHGVGDFIVLMDNSDFCISRTLPLQFPTLDFRHKVSRVRQLFEGYRVPVLSFIHSSFPPPQSLVPGSNSAIGHKPCPISNNSSYLLVFRSGAYKMDQSVDLDLALGLRRNPFHSIISTIAAPATTDTVLPPSSSPRFGKTTASELRSPKANSGATDRQSGLLHIILVETAWKSLVDARSAASQADASPREFGVEIGSVGAFLPRTEWAWTAGAFTCTLTCPEARHLIKAWTRLSNLIRLPQTHLTTRAGTLTVDATKSM